MKPTSLMLLEDAIEKRGCPQFASFTYDAQASGKRLTMERARHVILLGASLENLYQRDVEALTELIPSLTDLRLEAAYALLESRNHSLVVGIGNNEAATSADAYVALDCPGLKVHVASGDVHVMGLKVSKVTIIEGTYRHVNSKPLTIAKKEIGDLLPSSRLRQFNLGNRTVVKIDGQTLEFGDNH